MKNITFRDFSPAAQKVIAEVFYQQTACEADINGYLKCEAGHFYAQRYLIRANLLDDSLKLWHGKALKFENFDSGSDPIFEFLYIFEDRSLLFYIDENKFELDLSSGAWEWFEDNQIIRVEYERVFGKPWSLDDEQKLISVLEREASEKTRLYQSSRRRSEKLRANWDQRKRNSPESIIILNQKRSQWMKRYWEQKKAAAAAPDVSTNG